jgi:hypothetical protein
LDGGTTTISGCSFVTGGVDVHVAIAVIEHYADKVVVVEGATFEWD